MNYQLPLTILSYVLIFSRVIISMQQKSTYCGFPKLSIILYYNNYIILYYIILYYIILYYIILYYIILYYIILYYIILYYILRQVQTS